ncbi:MAG: hypothetical protein AAF708_01460 [Deinococcota bacterium]
MFKSDFDHLKPLLRYAQQVPVGSAWQADQAGQLSWLCSQVRYRRLPETDYQEALQLGSQLGQGSLRLLRIVAESLQALSSGKPAEALSRLGESLELTTSTDPFEGEAYRLGMHLARNQQDDALAARFADRQYASRQQYSRLQAVQALLTHPAEHLADDLVEVLDVYSDADAEVYPDTNLERDAWGAALPHDLEDPILADPVLADPVLADPVLADPILADTVLANTTFAEELDEDPKDKDPTPPAEFMPPIASPNSYVSISAVGDLSVPIKVFRTAPTEVLECDAFLIYIHGAMRRRALTLDILLEPRQQAEQMLLDARANISGVRLLSKTQVPLSFGGKDILAREGAGARLRLKLRTPKSWQDLDGMFDGPSFWQQLAQIVLLA